MSLLSKNDQFPNNNGKAEPSWENESLLNTTLQPDGHSQSSPNTHQSETEKKGLDDLFQMAEAESLREQFSSAPTVI